eukprot:1155639-Pelagomonas_calceolata.AAC.1
MRACKRSAVNRMACTMGLSLLVGAHLLTLGLLVCAEQITKAKAAISDVATRKDEDIQVQELLAEGGFGKVYRGKWRGTDVAVKIILHCMAQVRMCQICCLTRSANLLDKTAAFASTFHQLPTSQLSCIPPPLLVLHLSFDASCASASAFVFQLPGNMSGREKREKM